EQDIRSAAQPRYHLEMALLRWIYLRKLTPIEDLIAGVPVVGPAKAGPHVHVSGPHVHTEQAAPARQPVRPAQSVPSMTAAAKAAVASQRPGAPGILAPKAPGAVAPGTLAPGALAPGTAAPSASFKDALLAEIRKAKAAFYNMVVAQAQKIDVTADRVTFT